MILSLLPLTSLRASAGERIGVLMLHGKNRGDPLSPQYSPLRAAMEKQGWLVTLPELTAIGEGDPMFKRVSE